MSTTIARMHSLFRQLEEVGHRLAAGEGKEATDAAGLRLARALDELIEARPESILEALETFSPDVSAPLPASAPPGETRGSWRSYLSFQKVEPLNIRRPASLPEIVEILRDADRHGYRIKAVGSGHSFSDVAVTTDCLVEPHGIRRVLALDESVLKDPARPRVEVESGITVKALNEHLDQRGLALENMGSFDGQTICGAISTGTHGTGIGLGPMAAAVESLTLVTTGGKVYRIEPRDGITDPAKYRHPFIQLRQDDDWFHSTVVGMGCMGIVYSLVLRVQPAYRLEQRRRLIPWKELKPQLEKGAILREHRHFDVLINPYSTKGGHTCLVSVKDIVPSSAAAAPAAAGEPMTFQSALVRKIGLWLAKAIMIYAPQYTPWLLDFALNFLAYQDAHSVDKSFRMLAPGNLPIDGYAAEIGFPLASHTQAVEEVLRLAEHAARLGRQYQTSPFSLRYVQGAAAYLAPQYGRDTCMIEVPVIDGTVGGVEILHRFERAARRLGGRPHWGLELGLLNGNGGAVRALYPMYDRWLAVLRETGTDRGTFFNTFTSRLGFE